MCQRHLKKTINIGLLDSSLLTVASISAQTRGLFPSGALDAHPIKSSAPPGYHPNHRFLLGATRIIGSSRISPKSSAPPGYHPNHRLLLDINFQIINSSIYDIIRVIGIMFLELEDMYGIRLSIFYTLYITISYLSTGSGATPIGSASRAPDKKMEASSTMKNKPEDINIKIFE